MSPPTDAWACPRCGSHESRTVGGGLMYFLVMVGTASIFFWIGLVIWPFMVLALIALVLSPFVGALMRGGHRRQYCNRCREVWTPAQPDHREFRLRCRTCGNERTMTRGQVVADEDKVCGLCGTRAPWRPVS